MRIEFKRRDFSFDYRERYRHASVAQQCDTFAVVSSNLRQFFAGLHHMMRVGCQRVIDKFYALYRVKEGSF